MRVIVVNGEMCKEILHEEDSLALCIICENKEICNDCGLFNIKFKRNKNEFICERCACNPLERVSKSTIIECAKDLKMTTKAFFKVLEVAKNDIVIENAFFKVLEECERKKKKPLMILKKKG